VFFSGVRAEFPSIRLTTEIIFVTIGQSWRERDCAVSRNSAQHKTEAAVAALAAATSYDSPSVRNAQLSVVDIIYEAMLMKGRQVARGKMARVAKAISDHTVG
jgi:hypothetical protein